MNLVNNYEAAGQMLEADEGSLKNPIKESRYNGYKTSKDFTSSTCSKIKEAICEFFRNHGATLLFVGGMTCAAVVSPITVVVTTALSASGYLAVRRFTESKLSPEWFKRFFSDKVGVGALGGALGCAAGVNSLLAGTIFFSSMVPVVGSVLLGTLVGQAIETFKPKAQS